MVSRRVAGVMRFFGAAPARRDCRASPPPAAASASGSPHPDGAAVVPRSRPSRRTAPSSCRRSPVRHHVGGIPRPSALPRPPPSGPDDLLVRKPAPPHAVLLCLTGGLQLSVDWFSGSRSAGLSRGSPEWHTRAGRRLAAVVDEPPGRRPVSSQTLSPFLYNMWVFLFFFLHHPPSTTLASRRTAVRFGRLVVDGPPPSRPINHPINHAFQTPRRGPGDVHVETAPCPSASWKNSGRTDDGTHSDASTMPGESAASCVASRQVFPSTRRTEARTAPRSASSPSPPPVKGVPESSPCGSPRPGPLTRPPQSRTSACAVTPFVGHPSSVL